MPELPDVETFRRYLDATALHQRVADVRVRHDRVLSGVSASRLKRTVKGSSFEETDRHGKYLFVRLDQEPWLVLHFGMTGYLEYEKGRKPGQHDRVIFDCENGYSLAYLCQRLLGKVALAESPPQFAEDNKLGPDALRISHDDFTARLEGSHAAVKSCLMNQKLLAGIGNIYADEILFQAGVSPRRKGGTLSKTESKQLYRHVQRVLTMAADRKADPAGMPSSWLLPKRQEGRPCPRCGDKIKKTKVAGRSAYWCPNCQEA
jgi:formamidopyrimidine-DNA glycosylase